MNPCQHPGCRRQPLRSFAYCDAHTRAVLREAFSDTRPEWVRRRNTQGLPAKDYTTAA